jgi:hypothetical protein
LLCFHEAIYNSSIKLANRLVTETM